MNKIERIRKAEAADGYENGGYDEMGYRKDEDGPDQCCINDLLVVLKALDEANERIRLARNNLHLFFSDDPAHIDRAAEALRILERSDHENDS